MISVMDYPDVQSALNDAENGTSVYFPASQYVAPAGGWQITRSLEIWGDGPGTASQPGGTILQPFDPSSPVFTIVPPVRNVHIRDAEIRGTGLPGAGVGILCQSTATNQAIVRGIRLNDLVIHRFGGDGVRLHGYDAGGARVDDVTVENCIIELCMGSGLWLRHAFGVNVSSCLFRNNQQNGLGAEDGGVAIYASVFDGNARTSAWSRSSHPNEGQVRLERCEVARVDACQFLNIQEGGVRRGCVIVDCGGAMIGACYLEASASGDREGVVIRGTEGPVVILSNRFKNVDTLVKVDSGVPDCMVSPQGEVGSSVGVMDLPEPNLGMFGGAQVRKPGLNVLTGLIIPSGSDDPTESPVSGMLAYNTSGQALRVFHAGAWRTVEVL